MDLLAEIRRAHAALSAAPPGWLAEHVCAAVAVAHSAVAELQVLDQWNTAMGASGAALHLNIAEAALRDAWPSAWWTARPVEAQRPDLQPASVLDVARAVADLLDDTRAALARAAMDEHADSDGVPLTDRLAAARAIIDLDAAHRALIDLDAAHRALGEELAAADADTCP
jgi:hypothetical protein